MESILIIIPTKNSTKYLVKLVNSLLDQIDTNWRAIFVDFFNNSHMEYLKNFVKNVDFHRKQILIVDIRRSKFRIQTLQR